MAREEAQKWTLELKDSDDEKEQRRKKTARPRVKTDPDSSDEREAKKKRRVGKLKRSANASEDDGALFSGEEDGESKPVTKKV